MACSKRPTLKRYNSRTTECSTGGGIDEEDIDILVDAPQPGNSNDENR